MFTLKQQKRMLLRTDPDAKIVHEQETDAGFLLVDQDNINGPSQKARSLGDC